MSHRYSRATRRSMLRAFLVDEARRLGYVPSSRAAADAIGTSQGRAASLIRETFGPDPDGPRTRRDVIHRPLPAWLEPERR